MPVFADKAEFFAEGVDYTFSEGSSSPSQCTICLQTVRVDHSTSRIDSEGQSTEASEDSIDHHLHEGVRIKDCGHIHGLECLEAWLDVSCACPTCRRRLFTPLDEQSPTNDEVARMVRYIIAEIGLRSWGIYVESQLERISLRGARNAEDAMFWNAVQRARQSYEEGSTSFDPWMESAEDTSMDEDDDMNEDEYNDDEELTDDNENQEVADENEDELTEDEERELDDGAA